MTILCVNAPHFLFALEARKHGWDAHAPAVLLGPDGRVWAASPVALASGAAPGLSARLARARCPAGRRAGAAPCRGAVAGRGGGPGAPGRRTPFALERACAMTRIWPEGDPITVTVDDDGLPRLFIWHDHAHPVAQIEEQWQISTDWWSGDGAVSRECFRLVTRTGLLCEIFFNTQAQGWRLGRLYD